MPLIQRAREKFIYEMRRRFGLLEPLAGLRRFATEQPVRHVIDGGAHHGHFAERLARVFPAAVVHCFEPAPENFERLRARLAANARFRLNRAALAASSGRALLRLSAHDQTHSLRPWNESGRAMYPEESLARGEAEVETVSLDDYFAREGITRAGLIKLDLQGGEREALAGAAGILSRGAADCILTECFFIPHYEGAATADEITTMLAAHGYALSHYLGVERTPDGRPNFGDAVYALSRMTARGPAAGPKSGSRP